MLSRLLLPALEHLRTKSEAIWLVQYWKEHPCVHEEGEIQFQCKLPVVYVALRCDKCLVHLWVPLDAPVEVVSLLFETVDS